MGLFEISESVKAYIYLILSLHITGNMASALTAGYNNEILVSNSGFSLGRNDMVSASAPEKTSHKTHIILKHAYKTSIIPKHAHKEVPSKHTSAIMNEDEKITLVLVLTGAFGIWYAFQQCGVPDEGTLCRASSSSKA